MFSAKAMFSSCGGEPQLATIHQKFPPANNKKRCPILEK